MACDSEEAAKQSQSASKDVLPIVVGVVVFGAVAMVVAVNVPGPVQSWYNRNEERIMVRSCLVKIQYTSQHLARI